MRHIHLEISNELKIRTERNIPRGMMGRILIPILEDICAQNEEDGGKFVGALINRVITAPEYSGLSDTILRDHLLNTIKMINDSLNTDSCEDWGGVLSIIHTDLNKLLEARWPESTR